MHLLLNAEYVGYLSLVKLAIKFAGNRILAALPAWLSGTRSSSVKQIAKERGILFREIGDIHSAEFVEFLKAQRADVFICSVMPILKQPILSLPRLGCLNRHASLLPSYGGLLPVFQAVAHGEERVGTTIHLMDEKIDKGAILHQVAIPVEPRDTVLTLYQKCYAQAADGLVHALEILKGHKPATLVEPAPTPSYYSLPSRSDWEAFRRRGIAFI